MDPHETGESVPNDDEELEARRALAAERWQRRDEDDEDGELGESPPPSSEPDAELQHSAAESSNPQQTTTDGVEEGDPEPQHSAANGSNGVGVAEVDTEDEEKELQPYRRVDPVEAWNEDEKELFGEQESDEEDGELVDPEELTALEPGLVYNWRGEVVISDGQLPVPENEFPSKDAQPEELVRFCEERIRPITRHRELTKLEMDWAVNEFRRQGRCGARPRKPKTPGVHKRRRMPCATVCGEDSNQRCRLHGRGGGRKYRSWDSEKWKSKSPLRRRIEEAETNPNLLDLRNGIALFDVRIDELVKRVEEEDCPDYRRTALRLYQAMDQARSENDAQGYATAYRELGEWLREGRAESDAWEHLLLSAERRAARAEKAIDLSLKGQKAITERDFMLLLGRIMTVMTEEVGNIATTQRIVRRLDREIMDATGRRSGELRAELGQGTVS